MFAKIFVASALLWPMIVTAEWARPFTDLHTAGNVEAAARYESYLRSGSSCSPVNQGPRVILTGFGIWNDTQISYSGYLIDNLSSAAFWPEGAPQPEPEANYILRRGMLSAEEGARIVNRTLRLSDGREVSACLIMVDVLWDFAGAVLATEMERFQPQSVIMMGVGGRHMIEGGALNLAAPMAGYYPNGSPDELNVPESEGILAEFPAGSEIPMTWDLSRVFAAAKNFEPTVIVRPRAADSNDYVCNNISYIALQAARGETLRLAGGKIVLHPKIQARPRVGFYHFDSATPGGLPGLKRYAQMILKMVEATLN